MGRGVEILEEVEGTGEAAQKGDRVGFNLRLFLNRGDEVPLNELQVAEAPGHPAHEEAGRKLLDHTITLGRREVMAAVEQALVGMRKGGYRKIRASPHLAYRGEGIPGLIPPNAVLVIEIWLRDIAPPRPIGPAERGPFG